MDGRDKIENKTNYRHRDLNPKPSASETDALPLRHGDQHKSLTLLKIIKSTKFFTTSMLAINFNQLDEHSTLEFLSDVAQPFI